MKPKSLTSIAVVTFLIACSGMRPVTGAEPPPASECCVLVLPPATNNLIDFTVSWAYPPEVSDSFLTATVLVSGAVSPGVYASWCVDAQTDLLPGIEGYEYTGNIYSSTDPNLNLYLAVETANTNVLVGLEVWHLVNYILNHRTGYNYWDVQGAIWHFVGGPAPPTPPYPVFNPAAVNQLISDALTNGPGWLPQPGDKLAAVIVIIWPVDIQIIIIEVPCPETTPSLAISVNCPTDCGVNEFSGSVSNRGNVTLTNVHVFSSQPTDNTLVLGPITLAPGGVATFDGSYVIPCVTNLSTNTVSIITTNTVGEITTNTTFIVTTNTSPLVTTNTGFVVTTNALPVISTNTLPVITTNTVSLITTNTVPLVTTNTVLQITTNTVGVVITNTIPVITTNLFPVITTNTVSVITTNTVPLVTTNTVLQITTNTVGVVTTNSVPVITTNLFPVITTNTVSVTTTNTVPLITTNTVLQITTNTVGVVTTNSVPVITTNTVSIVTTNTVGVVTTNTVSVITTNTVPLITTNTVFTVTTNTVPVVTTNTVFVITTNTAVFITTNGSGTIPSPGGAATFGTIAPAGSIGTVTDRFTVGNNFHGLTYSDSDHGYAATKFYSIREDVGSGADFFDTIAPTGITGTITDRFPLPQYDFDALTYAAPDVGYGPIIFYYLRHDANGGSIFGSITPGGVVGVTTDHKVVGTNFDALTFSATDVGFGANLFYYVRHDANCNSIFGTIDPAQGGPVTDRFSIGPNVDALVFTSTDVGYGANNFYYLRHDSAGNSTFGTIFVTGLTSGNVTDRFSVGTNATELTFTPTDVLYGPNLFYYLRGTSKAGCTSFTTNIVTTFGTNEVTSFSTNDVTSFTTNGVTIFTTNLLTSFTTNLLTSFSTNNVTSFGTNLVTSFSTNILTSFSTNILTSFSTNILTSFSTNILTSFATNTLTSFSTNILTSFTTNLVTSFSTNLLASFATNILTSFSTNIVTSFTTNNLTSFATNLLTSFTTNLLTSFATNSVTSFATNILTSFSTNFLSSFTTNVVTSFATNLVTSFSTNLLTSFSTNILTSFSTNLLTSFTTNSVTSFATNILTSFSTNTVSSFATNVVITGLTNLVTASGTDACLARTVTATATCSSPGSQPVPLVNGGGKSAQPQYSNGVFSLSFATENGVSYLVQFKTALSDPAWTDLQVVPGTGGIVTVPHAVHGQPTCFYRVMIAP